MRWLHQVQHRANGHLAPGSPVQTKQHISRSQGSWGAHLSRPTASRQGLGRNAAAHDRRVREGLPICAPRRHGVWHAPHAARRSTLCGVRNQVEIRRRSLYDSQLGDCWPAYKCQRGSSRPRADYIAERTVTDPCAVQIVGIYNDRSASYDQHAGIHDQHSLAPVIYPGTASLVCVRCGDGGAMPTGPTGDCGRTGSRRQESVARTQQSDQSQGLWRMGRGHMARSTTSGRDLQKDGRTLAGGHLRHGAGHSRPRRIPALGD